IVDVVVGAVGGEADHPRAGFSAGDEVGGTDTRRGAQVDGFSADAGSGGVDAVQARCASRVIANDFQTVVVVGRSCRLRLWHRLAERITHMDVQQAIGVATRALGV